MALKRNDFNRINSLIFINYSIVYVCVHNPIHGSVQDKYFTSKRSSGRLLEILQKLDVHPINYRDFVGAR